MADRRIKILLIEDNEDDALLVRESLLEVAGSKFEIICVKRLKEGLKKIEEEGTDLVLLDLSLPDSAGIDTFIRVHEAASDIPIVLLTNLEDQDLAINAVHLGAQDYLMKKDANGPLLVRSIFYALERQELKAELLRKSRELESSNRDLEQFASVASHDLQEPIRMVSSYMELLVSDFASQLSDEAKEYVMFAHDGARRLSALIRDLLAYSRVGTEPLEHGTIDLMKIVRQVVSDLQGMISDADASIIFNDLPKMKGSRTQIQQLFQNLISNALKFRGERRPVVEIESKREREILTISVRDNGIGIDKADQNRIFEMFQRLHHRNEYPGTGIGLALSLRIVEAHGGDMWVDSEPGAGTTFFFTLPGS